MDLEYDGGAFEKVLRKYIFYFHPEYEYWFPPEPDFDEGLGNPIEEQIEKQVKWPVRIMREVITYPSGKKANQITIKLGRQYDDEREIKILFRSDDENKIKSIMLNHDKYLPGVQGPAKREELLMKFNKQGNEAKFMRAYWGTFSRDGDGNPQWNPDELYSYDTLAEFGDGNPNPVDGAIDGDGSIDGEPALEILGVEDLFTYPVDAWESEADLTAFQKFRDLINLCRLQFGLIEDGGEFEKYLRKYIFWYYPWEPWYESVDVKKIEMGAGVTDEQDFDFEIGLEALRDIYVKFREEHKSPEKVYKWELYGFRYVEGLYLCKDGGHYCSGDDTVEYLGQKEIYFYFDFDKDPATAYFKIEIINPEGEVTQSLMKKFYYGDTRVYEWKEG
jgi:hypothetical protein